METEVPRSHDRQQQDVPSNRADKVNRLPLHVVMKTYTHRQTLGCLLLPNKHLPYVRLGGGMRPWQRKLSNVHLLASCVADAKLKSSLCLLTYAKEREHGRNPFAIE